MALADRIRAAILGGRFAPGAVLSQTELAQAYGVSRIPVRDALQSLASERLVEVIPGKGARVVRLTREDLVEIRDLRLMLECDLLSRAMEKATTADHSDIEYVLRKSSLEAGRPGWQAGDRDFHLALYRPAARPRQLSIVEELRTSCALYASGYDSLASQTDRWLAEHEAIVTAYVGGRTDEACDILRQHILGAHAHLDALTR